VNIYKNKHIKKLIEDSKIDLKGDVSFDQHVCFFWFLSQLVIEKEKLFKDKPMTYENLRKVANEKLKQMPHESKVKREITDEQLKVLFKLLDTDQNGVIDYHEIDDILKRRTFYSASKSDYEESSKDILDFFRKGINFIKENIWFLKK
jgi:uncharacterized protein YpuA (DUF1002 family)